MSKNPKKQPKEKAPASIVSAPDYEAPPKGAILCLHCNTHQERAFVPCGMPFRAGICEKCSEQIQEKFKIPQLIAPGSCFSCNKEDTPIMWLKGIATYDGICQECSNLAYKVLHPEPGNSEIKPGVYLCTSTYNDRIDQKFKKHHTIIVLDHWAEQEICICKTASKDMATFHMHQDTIRKYWKFEGPLTPQAQEQAKELIAGYGYRPGHTDTPQPENTIADNRYMEGQQGVISF